MRSSLGGGIACAVIALVCSACEPPKPTVEYGLSVAPDSSGAIKFRLAKSAILVDYGKSSDGKAVDQSKISVAAVPQEDTTQTYTIAETSNLLGATHLKVTKRENTDLLLSIGSEVEDRRLDLIQQVGTFVGAVIPFLVSSSTAKDPVLPQAIDVLALVPKPVPGEVTVADKLGDAWSFDLTIGAIPKDAQRTDAYVAAFGKQVKSNVLFYSACRDAKLTITSGPFRGKSFSVKISDPNFVQTILLPPKGAVSFHSSCGVNVSSEKASSATTLELLNALMSQAKTLVDATKSKK